MEMCNRKAIMVLKNEIENETQSEELRAAMKIAVAHLEITTEQQEERERIIAAKIADYEKRKSCQYFKNGLCMGQKGMPECAHEHSDCPMLRKY